MEIFVSIAGAILIGVYSARLPMPLRWQLVVCLSGALVWHFGVRLLFEAVQR